MMRSLIIKTVSAPYVNDPPSPVRFYTLTMSMEGPYGASSVDTATLALWDDSRITLRRKLLLTIYGVPLHISLKELD